MKKSEIQKIYKNKLSLINKHNESYYDKSSSLINNIHNLDFYILTI